MALPEVCSNCGAVVGGRAFWSFISSKNRKYFSRCPLCGERDPWRKATKEDVSAFRDRAGKIHRDSAGSPGGRLLNAFWTLFFVAIVLTTCIWGEAE